MIQVVLCGALGRMGRTVAGEIATESDMSLIGAVEKPGHAELGTHLFGVEVTDDLEAVLPQCNVLVDFTSPEAALAHIRASADASRAAVVGTTGLSGEQLAAAQEAAERIPLLVSPNMSAGVNLLFRLVADTAAVLRDFDVEIIEVHHNRKKDSPSGTAARIADVLESVRPGLRRLHGREGIIGAREKNELGIHSLRGGDVVGEHTVIFAGDGERLELTHRAHSRRTFARGVLRAVRFIAGKGPGLYSMADVLGIGKP